MIEREREDRMNHKETQDEKLEKKKSVITDIKAHLYLKSRYNINTTLSPSFQVETEPDSHLCSH